MTPERALKIFKTQRQMAQHALVTPQAVTGWFKKGVIPPRSLKLLRAAYRAKRAALVALTKTGGV